MLLSGEIRSFQPGILRYVIDPHSRLNEDHTGHTSWAGESENSYHKRLALVRFGYMLNGHVIYQVLLTAFKVIIQLFTKLNKMWHSYCQTKCQIVLLFDRSLSFKPLTRFLVPYTNNSAIQRLGDWQPSFTLSFSTEDSVLVGLSLLFLLLF